MFRNNFITNLLLIVLIVIITIKTNSPTTEKNPTQEFSEDVCAENFQDSHYSKKLVNNPPPQIPKEDKKVVEFVERFYNVAKTEKKKYGIPASVNMAQALIESGVGESRLSLQNNNYFGIKCFSKTCKKGHCTNATDDHHKDFFKKYETPWKSWRDHSKLLTGDRYKGLLKYGDDYKKWASGLKKAGYATDKNYDKKLISTIEKYSLYKLDEELEN